MTRSELLKIAKPILFNTEMVQAILRRESKVNGIFTEIFLVIFIAAFSFLAWCAARREKTAKTVYWATWIIICAMYYMKVV